MKRSFSHSGIPKVFIIDGNYESKNQLLLEHEFIGAELEPEYAQKTLDHILFLWGDTCILNTIKNKMKYKYQSSKK